MADAGVGSEKEGGLRRFHRFGRSLLYPNIVEEFFGTKLFLAAKSVEVEEAGEWRLMCT